MTCQEARDLFSARADGLLGPDQRVALQGHLEGCVACRSEWERFSRTVELLQSVPEAQAPPAFARRVLEATRREPWPRRLLRSVFVPLHVKLPLEAAAVVLVSTLVILFSRQSPEFRRAVEAPPPAVTAPASEAPERSGYASSAPEPPPPAAEEKDRLAGKEAPAEQPASGGRLEAARAPRGQDLQAPRKSAVPPGELKVARPQGPFHLVGLLRARSVEAVDSQLDALVKQVGGILVRDADRVGPGSIVEIVLPREAYPRLEAGLRQLGDFSVETRAATFPAQVKVAVRIAS